MTDLICSKLRDRGVPPGVVGIAEIVGAAEFTDCAGLRWVEAA
jgi:hypothetical protein